MSRNEKGQFAAGAPSERRKQWIGERFGKLLVTDVKYGVQRGKKTRTICTCICDCGNTVETVADNLRQGKKTSCGCDTHERRVSSQRIDLTGRRFGRLTVVEMLWVYPHTKCRCICDCGNEAVVTNTQLTYGKTTSCGCVQRERTSIANTKDLSGYVAENGVKFIERHSHISTVETGGGVWVWECECPICGNHFYAIPATIMSRTTKASCGCLGQQISNGEAFVSAMLDDMNVRYIFQYSTKDCRYKNPLRFDFAILGDDDSPVHMIEYDGRQHFEAVDFFGGEDSFRETQRRDQIKNEYCALNNIQMTRLPYTMSYEEIRDTIKNIINP